LGVSPSHLPAKATGKTQAIVEVKRKLREGNKPNLEMQEAAEWLVGLWTMNIDQIRL
jgi:hypothetical protein